jgi:hypothetical protein
MTRFVIIAFLVAVLLIVAYLLVINGVAHTVPPAQRP